MTPDPETQRCTCPCNDPDKPGVMLTGWDAACPVHGEVVYPDEKKSNNDKSEGDPDSARVTLCRLIRHGIEALRDGDGDTTTARATLANLDQLERQHERELAEAWATEGETERVASELESQLAQLREQLATELDRRAEENAMPNSPRERTLRDAAQIVRDFTPEENDG